MMKFYRSSSNGVEFRAVIEETPQGYYAVSVKARMAYGQYYPDWNGKQGGYNTEKGALKALKRHYKGMRWQEE